jgi:hypothetical protein
MFRDLERDPDSGLLRSVSPLINLSLVGMLTFLLLFALS